LRKAGDFNARSVGMLVRALRQGTECFAVEERVRVGRAAEG
jgi:ribosome assembly protein 3